ncbi:conserved hypothetical protein [Hyella patelloides LEGE 07179]|uniref:DUF6888 domain-containing protein n=1 Tax=Hyella patelloides LEGE 07179 TaxID=945734 RepID=A0A563W5F9_9CYAN|nr:hypothetical protein [Hyella patelloides]VEP18932.1 conserved hypothetical protein [Hyella patelloides LEGE 07179]
MKTKSGGKLPTQEQMITAIRTLQSLSNFYRPIYLFRYDERTEQIFIIAGEAENVEITIYADGTKEHHIND